MSTVSDLRTVAIIAHVDHGKTTLVDALFQQSGIYRDNQAVVERAMDSMDQERERGITIMAKCTSVQYDDTQIQIVDTPGHADFGGEVERTLRMVDGVVLLVDAAEGPMPQTRFVLRKAMELKLPMVIAVNKIDRADARALEVVEECYSLLIDLGGDEEDLECPILFTNGRAGTASNDLDVPGTDIRPLVDAIISGIPAANRRVEQPFTMQVNQLGYDDYVGRLAVGRLYSGEIKINTPVKVVDASGSERNARIANIFGFKGTQRFPLDSAQGGDIVAIAGVGELNIGDTISLPEVTETFEPIEVDEPTVSMVFQVNDGPMAGRSGGKFVTSRHLKDRLEREAYSNPSIRIEPGESPDQFRVMARGELQLSVVIEGMRRELYEFCVRTPEVVTREGEEGKEEPLERLGIDVPTEFMGIVTEHIGPRRGVMLDQRLEGDRMRLEYTIPTRGIFGLRNLLLTTTRGTAIVHHVFEGWLPWCGDLPQRANGALVADRPGPTTNYALFNLQPRGELFIGSGIDTYEGMVVGEHSRDNDLNVNVVREKKLTNVRAAGKDDATTLAPPRQMPLERCLEWIRDDEMVEVTPEAIRIRKRVLGASQRQSKRG